MHEKPLLERPPVPFLLEISLELLHARDAHQLHKQSILLLTFSGKDFQCPVFSGKDSSFELYCCR